MPRLNQLSLIILVALIGADCFLWTRVFARPIETGMYALDIGQGDATLIVFQGGVKILTDAGPDASIAGQLEKLLPGGDRYIDIAVISHPQLDHYSGFTELIKRYRIGAFIANGREADDVSPGSPWRTLRDTIEREHIPLITLAARDRIVNADEAIDFLSPDESFIQSAELNDTGFVELVRGGGWRALLAADTGFVVEEYLRSHSDIHADILKVGHHGSKFSSGDAFLKAVSPRIATISDSAHNRYGHPAPETLARLNDATDARVFRTDTAGTISILPHDGGFTVRTEK